VFQMSMKIDTPKVDQNLPAQIKEESHAEEYIKKTDSFDGNQLTKKNSLFPNQRNGDALNDALDSLTSKTPLEKIGRRFVEL
jgi:hypothetical protein